MTSRQYFPKQSWTIPKFTHFDTHLHLCLVGLTLKWYERLENAASNQEWYESCLLDHGNGSKTEILIATHNWFKQIKKNH